MQKEEGRRGIGREGGRKSERKSGRKTRKDGTRERESTPEFRRAAS